MLEIYCNSMHVLFTWDPDTESVHTTPSEKRGFLTLSYPRFLFYSHFSNSYTSKWPLCAPQSHFSIEPRRGLQILALKTIIGIETLVLHCTNGDYKWKLTSSDTNVRFVLLQKSFQTAFFDLARGKTLRMRTNWLFLQMQVWLTVPTSVKGAVHSCFPELFYSTYWHCLPRSRWNRPDWDEQIVDFPGEVCKGERPGRFYPKSTVCVLAPYGSACFAHSGYSGNDCSSHRT